MSEEGQPPTPQPPRRGGRWLRRIAVVLLLCITAGLLFYNLFVPAIAKNVATGILEDLGFKEVELQVHAVSTSGLYASNLREGSDHFRIGAIGVNYNVSDLLDGKIETITLIGVEWEMQIRDGQITIAPFDALPKSTDDEPAGELPFKTVRLQSSIVGIDWDGYKLRIPVDATITNEGDQQFSVVMNLDLLGTPLQIKGDLKPETDEHGHQLTAVSADIQYLKTPWSVRGKINPEDQTIDIDVKLAGQEANSESPDQDSIGVEMAFHRYSDGHSLQLDIWTRQNDWKLALFGDTAEATKLEAQLSLAINEELKITEMLATFESPNMSWNDMTLRDVVVSLDQRDGMLNGLAQAAGEQWTSNIKADAPSIGQLLAGAKEHNINASWQLDGRIPHWIADQVARFGYRIDQREDANFSGRATALLRRRHANEQASLGKSPSHSHEPSWQVESDEITLALGDSDFKPYDDRFRFQGLNGELKFSFKVSPLSLQLRLLPESTLAFKDAVFNAYSPIKVGGNSFSFTTDNESGDQDTVNHLTMQMENGTWRGRAFAAMKNPLSIKSGSINATLAQLSLDGAIGADATDPTDNSKDSETTTNPSIPLAISLSFSESSFSDSANEIEIKNIRATIPVSSNGAIVKKGQFSLDDIKYRKQSLPPAKGTASLADGIAQATVEWKPLTHATVSAQATVDLSTSASNGRLNVNAPPFAWTSADQTLAKSLFPTIGDVILDGTLGVDAQIDFSSDTVNPNIHLSTNQLSIRSKELDVAFVGVTGTLNITNFDPIATPGRQNLQIKEIRSGEIKLNDGTVAYRIENPDSIFIERASCSWGDKGTFYVHAFRLEPKTPQFDLELFVENLELQNWIAILSVQRVTGTGRVYGRVPLKIRPADRNPIAVGRGVLYVIPEPKKPGEDSRTANTLQFHDSEFLRKLLISSEPRFASDPKMKETLDTLVEAFKDFKYDRLTFDFVPRPEHDDLQLRIITSGVGFKESGGTKVKAPVDNLTVNLNVEEDAIKRALFYKRGSENSIQNALENFFKP